MQMAMVSMLWRVISWSVVGGMVIGFGVSKAQAEQPKSTPSPQAAKNRDAKQGKQPDNHRQAEQAKQKVQQIMREEEQAQSLVKAV